jgi:hypothetical protein
MTETTQVQTTRRASAAGRGIRPDMLFAGVVTLLYAGISLDGGILTQAYRGASPVADDRLTFPWDGATAIATSLTWGVSQLLFVAALVVFARSRAVGSGRSGRVGAWLTVAGGVLLAAGHALTLVFLDATMDDLGGIAVMAAFGVGSLVTLVGFVMAGAATLRAGRWSSWRRHAPLAVAVALLAVVPLQFTPLLPLSLVPYAVAIVWFGAALLAEGADR